MYPRAPENPMATSFPTMTVQRQELRAVANLYSDIKATRALSAAEDAQMTRSFDAHIGA